MVLLVDQEVLRGSFMYPDLHLYCVLTGKSNKVLLFWDPGIPVCFDLLCCEKTLLVAVVSFLWKICVPGWFPVHYSVASRREEWWGRRVPDGQLIPESGNQAGSRSWPGRTCEPRSRHADPAESVLLS